MNAELVAPCGIDCMHCQVHAANITPETRARMAQATGKSPDQVACQGCRPQEGKNLPLIQACPTYACVTARNLEFCGDCADFPCPKLAPCAYRAEVFPHNLKMYNLCRIKKLGVKGWLQEAAENRRTYYQGVLIPGSGPKLKSE